MVKGRGIKSLGLPLSASPTRIFPYLCQGHGRPSLTPVLLTFHPKSRTRQREEHLKEMRVFAFKRYIN